MANASVQRLKLGVASGRIGKAEANRNFGDLHPPLTPHQALVASDRCYFCYDAPCVTACPTEIDIPQFIREISTGNEIAAAETIFAQNILGGMCARVCPTETLCEGDCVREEAEGKPVQIGLLQRFATDAAMANKKNKFKQATNSGMSVAVVGAGPASLACAHRLALNGHAVTIYEAKKKPGGLNEFGIAAYKAPDDFAQREVDFVTSLKGITFEYGKRLGKNLTLSKLQKSHDAVFLGIGMGDVNSLGLAGKEPKGVEDAVQFIAKLRQAKDKSKLPVGRNVVVIGGGMTAIDAAIQCKLLGAEEVTLCYRRGADKMNASEYEQELATQNGVVIRHWLQPVKLKKSKDRLSAIEFEYTNQTGGKLVGTGEKVTLKADQVFKAIGQKLLTDDASACDVAIVKGRIKTKADGATSVKGIWAGGDCTGRGEDLTVTAVAQGRDAAESIHTWLSK